MSIRDISVQSINQIEKTLESLPPEKQKEFLSALKDDNRIGVQKLATKNENRFRKKRLEEESYKSLFAFECDMHEKGFKHIAGVDEAGRGPLAGPLVAAGVVLPRDKMIPGLKDSKKLSAKKRDEIYLIILDTALSYSVRVYDNQTIDSRGLHRTNLEALKRAAEDLHVRPDFVLVDGYKISTLSIPNLKVIKGDIVSASIAAASVLAKVSRDRIMLDYHKQYPQYGFDSHKGYGSEKHFEALKTHGLTPIHRISFQVLEQFNKK